MEEKKNDEHFQIETKEKQKHMRTEMTLCALGALVSSQGVHSLALGGDGNILQYERERE